MDQKEHWSSLSSVGQESLAAGPIAVTAGCIINVKTTASFYLPFDAYCSTFFHH